MDELNCSLNVYGGEELVQLVSLCYQLLAVQITAVMMFKTNFESFQNKVSLVFKKVSRKHSSRRLMVHTLNLKLSFQ